MADESIVALLRPDFPKVVEDGSGKKTALEYIGPYSTLSSAKPAKGAAWGAYAGFVESTEISEITGTDYGILSVNVATPTIDEEGGGGTVTGSISTVRFEVEWVVFSRSLYEHPVFAIGGGGANALTSKDYAAIRLWENNDDEVKKGEYKYVPNPNAPDTFDTLSTNAQKFAKGLQLGQQNWEDYAPVIRKTTTYVGGLPGFSQAGQKDNPPSFSGGPTGYQWKKTADRAVQSNEDFDWDRVEEWTGGKKILIDKDQVFW